MFLGRLEDEAGTAQREVALRPCLNEVIGELEPDLAEILRGKTIKLAVNGILLQDFDAPVLRDGDEVAFLPPVSGG